MVCSLIQVQYVDSFWPHVKDGFEKARLKTGSSLTVGSLWQQCRSGEAFLVVVHDEKSVLAGAVVRPEESKLRVLVLYGGDMDEWFNDIVAFGKRIAADCGADALRFEGRAGWKKKFPKAKVLRVLYEEPL